MNNTIMKKIAILLTFLLINTNCGFATVLEGGINENSIKKPFCTVIDKRTKLPVPNAKVTVASKNFTAYTDVNGHFELSTTINGTTILSVEKPNYRTHSITINKGANLKPFVVEVEGSTPFDIKLETRLCHLGDNNYSTASANAGQFISTSVGSVFSKNFFIPISSRNKQNYLVIGSVIGIDTALARGMGQNNISTTFASPPSVYLNGRKIAEIKINGDNQKIKLPNELIKYNQINTITIKAGVNLMQTAYVDYDDIEFTNLSIQAF